MAVRAPIRRAKRTGWRTMPSPNGCGDADPLHPTDTRRGLGSALGKEPHPNYAQSGNAGRENRIRALGKAAEKMQVVCDRGFAKREATMRVAAPAPDGPVTGSRRVREE